MRMRSGNVCSSSNNNNNNHNHNHDYSVYNVIVITKVLSRGSRAKTQICILYILFLRVNMFTLKNKMYKIQIC